MVFICPNEYENSEHNSYFEYFPFELSNWQKWSIQSIVEGNHSLVTAPTGSGKTLPAEFSIKYFHSIGKKIIYTSPIKALSNQKYHNNLHCTYLTIDAFYKYHFSFDFR